MSGKSSRLIVDVGEQPFDECLIDLAARHLGGPSIIRRRLLGGCGEWNVRTLDHLGVGREGQRMSEEVGAQPEEESTTPGRIGSECEQVPDETRPLVVVIAERPDLLELVDDDEERVVERNVEGL